MCKKTALLFLFICTIFIGCQKHSSTLIPDQPVAKTKIIVVLGSSTAAGTGATPIDSSWVNKLKYQLVKDNRNTQVINLAMGGYTTYKVLPSAYASADTSRNVTKALNYKPDLIIINLPTNDFDAGYSDETILKNYNKITTAITGAHIPFMLTSTQPRDFPTLNKRKRLQLFNPKLTAAYPGAVVNVYDQLATPDYFINPQYARGDGIHLNNKGHHIIFQSILNFPVLKSVLY